MWMTITVAIARSDECDGYTADGKLMVKAM